MIMPGGLEHHALYNSDGEIHLIQQPMPYPLGTSNSYLIEGDNGWSIIDVGVDIPSTRHIWQQVLNEIGIEWSQINSIYITHCHPDHLGAAAWIQQLSDAPVFMLDAELERAERFIFLGEDYAQQYCDVIQEEIQLHGFGEERSQRLAFDWQNEVHPLYPEPDMTIALKAGDRVNLTGKSYEIVKLPGHTDGQIGFWLPKEGMLFSADLLAEKGSYLHFTDWPNTESPNPLWDMFQALSWVQEAGVNTIYPGHGLKIEQPNRLIELLRNRHLRLLNRVLDLLIVPNSASEMYQQLVPLSDDDYIHHHRVSLGEALGYMRYLEAVGEAYSYFEEGVLKFARK